MTQDKAKGFSLARLWAFGRNSKKAQLRAILGKLTAMQGELILLQVERKKIQAAVKQIQLVLVSWEKRNPISKKAFLKRKGEV